MDDFLDLMIPVTGSPSPRGRAPIATLAFIDLETTGLPSFVGKKNVHITELSILAMERTDFEEDASIRLANKLSLLIRPRSSISYGAMKITGLADDIMETKKPFDNSVLNMIQGFFGHLRSPICLIAHNGNKFDFPILQAELKRIGFHTGDNIMCADTLEAFRTLGHMPPTVINRSPSFPITNLDINEENHDNHTQTSHLNLSKDNHNHTQTTHIDLNKESQSPNSLQSTSKDDEEFEKLLSQGLEEFRDFPDEELSSTPEDRREEVGEILRNGRLPAGLRESTPDPELKCNVKKYYRKEGILNLENRYDAKAVKRSKRRLFEEGESTIAKKPNFVEIKANTINKRVSYTLEKLYMHYFSEEPQNSHNAESDCIALCKICQKVNSTFLDWLDKNYEPFSSVIPFW